MVNNKRATPDKTAGSTKREPLKGCPDAAELIKAVCNCFRECIIPELRGCYAVTNSGNSAPNAVPDYRRLALEKA